MRVSPSPKLRGFLLACLLPIFGSAGSVFGLTLEDLSNTPNLTPQKFAGYFRDFEFKFRREVQSPEVFLATRSGDCDDFSTLAAAVLRNRGYTPRLITVRMRGVVHVVCYIAETKSYLDYNHRACLETVASPAELDAVADLVAKSYNLDWVSASEFTYERGVKRLVQTVLCRKTERSLASLFR